MQTVVVGVDFPERRMFFNHFVDQRLSNGWIIHFAVAMATIADQVNHDVAAKCVAIIERQPRYADHCIYVFGIDMENGYVLAAGKLRRKQRRMQLA